LTHIDLPQPFSSPPPLFRRSFCLGECHFLLTSRWEHDRAGLFSTPCLIHPLVSVTVFDPVLTPALTSLFSGFLPLSRHPPGSYQQTFSWIIPSPPIAQIFTSISPFSSPRSPSPTPPSHGFFEVCPQSRFICILLYSPFTFPLLIYFSYGTAAFFSILGTAE